MNEQDHDWISLHRVRFAAPIAARDNSFSLVGAASVWRFCPQHVPGADGLTTLTSEIWGGLGIWDRRAEAEAMLADQGAAIHCLAEAEAMLEAAYQDGRHRARMEQDCAGLMFDHSFFTRLRALHSQGDWNGDHLLNCRKVPILWKN